MSVAAGLVPAIVPNARANPLSGRAMWVWELPDTDRGNVGAIISDAHRYGMSTLIIKSSDGTGFWSSQFTRGLVSVLHRHGLKVCAWQYVYGSHPITEAYMGADAVHDGANCLIIDAESEYEGKYVAAQRYIKRLRKLIGYPYPLALATFPYVDFHPAFPYSVFLGPGGAQYNAPQMYWKAIGVSVDAVYAHTYAYNRIYNRPIYPLGQVYDSPPARQIVRFRELSRAYGAGGVSWWDWQESDHGAWLSVSRPAGALAGYATNRQMAAIKRGARGDLVVWAQEHLISAGYRMGVDGVFGAGTQRAVKSFQAKHGLTPDGVIGTQTWRILIRYRTVRITWGARRPAHTTRAASRPTTALAAATAATPRLPRSASLPARRNELAGAGGRGGRP
jgi:hypothetical protein